MTQALPPIGTVGDLANPFEMVSVNAANAPSGMNGSDWFRYEISQGPNRIVGFRTGSQLGVTEHVRLMVEHLNERRQHRRGRVHVVLDGGKRGDRAFR